MPISPSSCSNIRFLALFVSVFAACLPTEREESTDLAEVSHARLEEVENFDLELGEVLHTETEEHGLDVKVEVSGPSGETILVFDSPTNGQGLERVCLVAEEPGRYQIRNRYPTPFGGSFQINRSKTGIADEQDRACWYATQLFSDAEGRLKSDGPTLIPQYLKVARLWQRSKAPYREAITWMRLGDLYSKLGQLEKEAESYHRAIKLLEGLGDRPHEQATAMRLLANARWSQGFLTDAEHLLSGALSVAQRAGKTWAEAEVRNTFALLKKSRGEAHLAVREFKQVFEIWQREGRSDKEAESLFFLGQIHAEELSRFPEAIDFLDRALAIWRRLGKIEELANTLIIRGWASYRLGDARTAIGFFKEALRLSETAGLQPSATSALDRLGTSYRSLGQLAEARAAFERSLEISQASGHLRNRAQTEANLGLLLIDTGELVEGERLLEKALGLLRHFGDRDAVAHVLTGLATAERASGNLRGALGNYREAIELLNSLRSSARQQGGRLPPDPIWQTYYEDYIDLLIEVAILEDDKRAVAMAFETAEMNRSRNLYEILLEAGVELRHDADPRVLERERELIAQFNAIKEKHTAGQKAIASKQLRALGLELEGIRDEIRLSNPRFAEIHDPAKIELEEIQALLGSETQILSIVLGQHRSFLFKVSAENIENYVLSPRHEIEQQARAAYAGLTRRRSPGVAQARIATRELASTLFEPLGGPPESSRLVIVTDGSLAYIPFAALPWPGQPERLLIDRYEIVQLPSAAISLPLFRRSATRGRSAKELAILAGPVFSREDPRLGGLHPQSSGAGANSLLGLIPHAIVEAQSILELYPEHQRMAALGFDARLDLLRQGRLKNFRILHFATHAIIDEEHPGRSRLVLSHFDRLGNSYAGDLRLAELYSLDLPADLVVLSACRTALGQPVSGNGLVGLTHGFLYAGASRLVVSLWDVDDQATAELMAQFHRQLRRNLPPGEALRRAQIALRKNPRYILPYFWASFIMQGDWSRLSFQAE